MNLKGLLKTSLLDYPGNMCSILFNGGCNLRCCYCHNPELALNSANLPVIPDEEVLAFLKKRKNLVSAVTITGGEPTLDPSLKEFLTSLKEMDFSIKLDTNGMKPEVLPELFEANLVDYLAMDVKTSPEKYVELAGPHADFSKIEQSLAYFKKYKINYEIRTTCFPPFVQKDDLKKIGKRLGRVDKLYLQQYVPNSTLDVEASKIEPYTYSQLGELKEVASKFADICEIRGF